MIQPIVLYSSNKTSILRNQTHLVDVEIDKEQTENLIQDLKDTLEHVGGLGLAANQIAISKRVCICKINNDIISMINPTVTPIGSKDEDSLEGCLSIPDTIIKVKRYKSVKVHYINQDNWLDKEIIINFPQSVVVQHEVDHLDGKLITDNLTPMEMSLISTKLKRISRGTLPINYVGLIWKDSKKTWQLVGNSRSLNYLRKYRLGKVLEQYNDLKQQKKADSSDTEVTES